MEPGPITIPAARLVELVNERARAFAGFGVTFASFSLTPGCYTHCVTVSIDNAGAVESVGVYSGQVFVQFAAAPAIASVALSDGTVQHTAPLPGADYPLKWWSRPAGNVSPVVQA